MTDNNQKFNPYKAKYSKKEEKKTSQNSKVMESEKTPIKVNFYKDKYRKNDQVVANDLEMETGKIDEEVNLSERNSTSINSTEESKPNVLESKTNAQEKQPVTNFNPYKEKQELKQAEILREMERKNRESGKPLETTPGYFRWIPKFPSISSSSISMQNFHNGSSYLVLLLTFCFLIKLLNMFYRLWKENLPKSKEKRTVIHDHKSTIDLAERLQSLTEQICESDSRASQLQKFGVSFPDLTSQMSFTQLPKSKGMHSIEDDLREKELLLNLKDLLREFLKADFIQAYNESELNELPEALPTGSTRKSGGSIIQKPRKKMFEDFYKIENAMKSLTVYYDNYIYRAKEYLYQSSERHQHAHNHFHGDHQENTTPAMQYSHRVQLQYFEKYQKLLLLKEILIFYFEFLQKILKNVSFSVNYQQSFKIHEIMIKLEEKIMIYKDSNQIYEQHIINEIIYNQCILQSYLSSFYNLFTPQSVPSTPALSSKSNHKEKKGNETIQIQYREEDIQLIVSECDQIINDFYLAKKTEIEQEEKEFSRKQEQKLLLLQQQQHRQQQEYVANSPLLSWTPGTNRSTSPTSPGDDMLNYGNERSVSPGITNETLIYTETQVSTTLATNSPAPRPNTLVRFPPASSALVAQPTQPLEIHQHQQTLQMFHMMQYQQNENNQRQRLLALETMKYNLYKDYQQQSMKLLEEISLLENEKKKEKNMEIENEKKEYEKEKKEMQFQINSFLNSLYSIQDNKNFLIFQILFIFMIFLILVRTSKYDVQCFSFGEKDPYYHHIQRKPNNFIAKNVGCLFECVFRTLEEIAHEINQKTSVSSIFLSSKGSSSNPTISVVTASSNYSYFTSFLPSIDQLMIMTNPFSSLKWSNLIYYLEKSMISFLSFFSITPEGFMKTSQWYYELILCFLNLSIRYLPIAIIKKSLEFLGISWNESINMTSIHYYYQGKNSNNHNPDQQSSLWNSLYQSFLQSLTLLNLCKGCLYLYCYLDILAVIMNYFYELFFWAFLIHYFFYQIFQFFNLSLILLESSWKYMQFYLMYSGFMILLIFSIVHPPTR